MLKIENLQKKYGKRTLFSNFTYEFPDKGLFAILGDSGSGKSTILNLISGLDLDYDGTISLDGIDFRKINSNKIQEFRLKNIGYVFQNFNLLNLETAFNNVFLQIGKTVIHTVIDHNCAPLQILQLQQLEWIWMPDHLCWNILRYQIPERLHFHRMPVHGLNHRNRYHMPIRHHRRSIQTSCRDNPSYR